LTLFAEDSLVKTYPWLGAVLDWLVSDPDSSSSSCVPLMNSLPVGFSSRTSLAFCQATEEGTWASSSGRWGNSGMGTPTVCLTLNTSKWPKGAVVLSLSDVLETVPVSSRYYWRPEAARGGLRRAEKLVVSLPPSLQAAVEQAARADRAQSQTSY